jgi:long-chain acyl-CoA synthetase
VAILGENSPHWGIAYFSITSLGAVAVPILPDFHATDIARIIEHSESVVLFVSRRLFAKAAAAMPGLVTVVLLDDFSVVPPSLIRRDAEAAPAFEVTETALQALGDPPPLGGREPREDDLAAIVYTSGTTGHSKGVMLSHGNLVSDAWGTLTISQVKADDRMLSILPLPHTYECTLGLITPIMIGASVFYLDRPPSAPVLLPALARVRPTVMLSVPLVIEKIYRASVLPGITKSALFRSLHARPLGRRLLHRLAGRKLLRIFGGKLRLFAIGGAPLAADVELFLREGGFPYCIGYGLTETSPLIAGCPPATTRYRSTGLPLPGTSIRIAHPNPETGEGEIEVQGPTVMKGYFRDEERTRESFTADGWLRTGDLGVIAPDGYLTIRGRSKNMILGPSGKNIYPEELESIINEFEHVRESLVYEHQKRLVALIHLDYEKLQRMLQSLSETDLRKKANDLLADLHKQINERVPLYARIHKLVEHEDPFEKTPTQKIKRHLYVP